VWGTKGLEGGWEEVVAHSECAGRFAEELPRTLREMRAQNAGEFEDVRLVPPTLTFLDRMVIELGPGLSLELHALPGHTPDSIVGFIPEWGILLAGDAAETPLPFLNPGGSLEGWARELEGWTQGRGVEVVIPAHGPVGGPDLLSGNSSYLNSLLAGQEAELPSELSPFYEETHAANLRLARGE
jgi:glyoxylase-like metal-dependent hydrolase (beta-lactamase superfamily II)